ncbi:MAG: Outer membrane protein assembly factor BamD [Alphaproteobacteria bacterium MarineAlpha11_Bin1]|nr:MAG: Outer membrane protein assembly factor BamD [Alphaproteobacteria bacterium MarineAlpha11_Bin1]
MFHYIRQIILGLAVCLILAACGTSKNNQDVYIEKKVEPLYNSAVNALQAKDYLAAAGAFEEVERQHPYSLWAIKAKLMAAYSHYQANQYDEAVIGLDRYIRLHPGNPDVPYAYYLKALSYYEQISDVSRDQRVTEQALDSLTEIVRRFPDSKYSRDAKLKIDLTRDHLAGKHMEVGRYYHDRGHYLAAINRFRRVVDNYGTSTNVPEALHRLVEAYTAIGVMDEARKAAAVLGYNYPGSEWYLDSYKVATGSDLRNPPEKKGFFARTWERLF